MNNGNKTAAIPLGEKKMLERMFFPLCISTNQAKVQGLRDEEKVSLERLAR